MVESVNPYPHTPDTMAVELEVPYGRASPLFALRYAARASTVVSRCMSIAIIRRIAQDKYKLLELMSHRFHNLAATPESVTPAMIPKLEEDRARAIELVYDSPARVGHLEGPMSPGIAGDHPDSWANHAIDVTTVSGNKIRLTHVNSWTTGMEIRERLEAIVGAPPRQIRLVANGQMLMDHMRLADAHVVKGGEIAMVLKFIDGVNHVVADPADARPYGMGQMATFDFAFNTRGWQAYVNHPVWSGIQIHEGVTLGQLTETVVACAIRDKIPLPKGFRVAIWGWVETDDDPPLEMCVGPCAHFVITDE